MNLAALFAALAGVPRLDGALCRGKHELYDSPEPDDISAATELCSWCPALTACADWVASLPPKQRPAGVVAGQIHVPVTPDATRPRGRPRKTVVA